MKLTKYELEAERQYRFNERAGMMYEGRPLTAEQMAEIERLIEPEMEALRNFEYEE